MLAETVLNNLDWAIGLAGAMFALTVLAGMLNPARKRDIGNWLKGQYSEQSWSRSFIRLFDAVFGDRHLSLRCFLRSVFASLLSVVLIWLLMGSTDAIGARLQSEVNLGSILIVALLINVAADYVSLIETRFLLGRMPRGAFAQIGVLALDIVISAGIIWVAILGIQVLLGGPLTFLAPDGWSVGTRPESFAEVLGLFSVFSVFFYSTFLTSVWTWAYIGSTWLMRLAVRLRLAFWFDVEKQPVKTLILLLASSVGTVTFAGSLVLASALNHDDKGLTAVDRALCMIFPGRVCLDVAALTVDNRAHLELLEPILLLCEGAFTEQCIDARLASAGFTASEAKRVFEIACGAGHAYACTNLGWLHERGIGMDRDLDAAARLFRQGCDGGNARGCTNLGWFHEGGIGMDPDPDAAARLYRQGCDGGSALACTNLGWLHEHGIGMDPDPDAAARLYRQGCDGGNADGCTSLGWFHEHGIGMDRDLDAAARLFRQGCDGGNARGCYSLGVLYANGIGMDTADPAAAARLYRQACDGGDANGCTNLGWFYLRGIGMDINLAAAARFYRKGCDGGNAISCTNLGFFHLEGVGVDPDSSAAARFFRKGCNLGGETACSLVSE